MTNRYPLWKNLLILIVALCGFYYAAPNLYAPDPALQIAGASSAQAAVTVEPSDRVNTKSDASTVEVRTGDENETTIPSPGPWKLVHPSWS